MIIRRQTGISARIILLANLNMICRVTFVNVEELAESHAEKHSFIIQFVT